MVFTSGVKNVETEAYDVTNEVLSGYDSRLIIDGLDLVGVAENASFKSKVTIPLEIANICNGALAYIEKVDEIYPSIEMLSNASLVNIDSYAF